MNIIRIIAVILTLGCSLLFITSIFSYGDREKGLRIHKEMPGSADLKIINIKNIVTFLTGLLFLCAAGGFILQWDFLNWAGIIGSAIFVLFYIYELILWGRNHPPVWGGFLMFGTLSILIGLYSLYHLRISV
ncbi:MAG: hypothetical protein JEY91_04485 [Spirochaetaceae bacterium]|nr:hypothetical protein [Spirochaetaceae bacterium]